MGHSKRSSAGWPRTRPVVGARAQSCPALNVTSGLEMSPSPPNSSSATPATSTSTTTPSASRGSRRLPRSVGVTPCMVEAVGSHRRLRETVAMNGPSLLKRLRTLPCGQRLLNAAASQDGVHLVGGAVRDLVHGRFGTATVRQGACRWDLACARAEDYARPGALPDVRAAGIDEDLRRRDVTINAIALELASGALRAVEHARADLDARRLRVLHDASFVDDPTRLWRIARYAARLGFELEEHTAQLAREAVRAGALDTVSGARI